MQTQTPILNEHKLETSAEGKVEYQPMHNGEFNTSQTKATL